MSQIYPPAYRHLWQDDCSAYLDRNYGPEGYRKDLERPGNAYFLLEQNGQDRGILLFNTNRPLPEQAERSATYLQKLYLHASTQGRGIGRILIEWVAGEARRRGHSLLWLETMHKGPARSIYRKWGFEEVAPFSLEAPLVRTEEVGMWRMSKELG